MQNPAFIENLFKIGRTGRSPQQRAKDLFTTGLPNQFEVCYEKDVPDCDLVEKLVHQKLKKYRHRADREYFLISLQEAISTVEEVIRNEFDKIAPSIHSHP